MSEKASRTNFSTWSKEKLISRVTDLEERLKRAEQTLGTACRPGSDSHSSRDKPPRPFDASKYSTRFIALKFAYLGSKYNGFEHTANNPTPLPTIEEEIWRALVKTRLISPPTLDKSPTGKPEDAEVSWQGCEYSKCGRTDKGVSAFGQVIALRVRSSKPLEQHDDGGTENKKGFQGKDWDPIKDELPYVYLLNKVLPRDIRMLAWCPSLPPNFSARHSCKERQYKYFFTHPAFPPVPSGSGIYETVSGKRMREGWLDIEAMREAASFYVGEHDFRNLCKIDPSKQLTHWRRRIYHADIEAVPVSHGMVNYVSKDGFHSPTEPSVGETVSVGTPTTAPQIFCFTVHGSAFLWHQVRHLVSVLFVVGQGLEPPSIVRDLLNISNIPCKPQYAMASDAPLVLWNCIFPAEGSHSGEDALEWIYIGDDPQDSEAIKMPSKFDKGGIVDDLWQQWRGQKIQEILAGTLLDLVAAQGNIEGAVRSNQAVRKERAKIRVFEGGDIGQQVGTYKPILKRSRFEDPETLNSKYAVRKRWDTEEIERRRAKANTDEEK